MRIRSRHLTVIVATVALAAAGGMATASPAAAATSWWVDNTAANCSNSGPGTADTPLCTISAAAAKAVGAGDTVTVRPGAYAEQVTVAGSGASGAPITFTTSGPGVVIVGTRDLSAAAWTPASGATWSVPYAPPSPPRQVFVDGKALQAGSGAATLSPSQFFYDPVAKVLYLDLGGTAPTSHTVLAGAQTYGVNAAGRSNVVVRGFTATGQNNAGFRASGSSAVTLDGVTSTDAGVNGVLLEQSSSAVTVTASTVRRSGSVGIKLSSVTGVRLSGNTVTSSGNHGISLVGAPGTVVEHNESADNQVASGTATAAGIDINSASTDVVARGNLVHGNQDSGIQVYNGSNRAIVVRNISWGNQDHGLDTLGSTGVRYVANTVVGNRTDGISIEGQSTGATLRNNIAVDNGLATGTPNLYVEQTSMPGLTADRDILWNSAWIPSVRVGLTRYRTLADFASATGQEAGGLGVDPNFVDAASHDYGLSVNSAAIDSADASASGFEPADRTGATPVDDPSVPDTGLGTPSYADRGALERQPLAGDPVESPPYAALVLSAGTGQVPPAVGVTADATGSSDADASGIASYTFDFGDGTTVGPQAGGTASHAYVKTGAFVVTVTVTDAAGRSGSAQRAVTLTDRPLVTYRVDRPDPSCNDSADGVATPFCTIGKAAAVALAGDTVVVEPGDYPEQVTPANTGMPGAPLTFRAHGPGVRLLGTTDVSTPSLWTATSTAAWKATVTSASPVAQVFLSGNRLVKAGSATTTTSGTFFYDAATSTLYVDAGGANPATVGSVLASTRTYGFKLWNADSVVVEGFTAWGPNGVGFSVQDASNVVISGVTAQKAANYGISSDRSTATKVVGSTARDNGSIGIRMATTNRASVTSSNSHDNGFHGISLQGSPDGTVADNTAYENSYPTQRQAAGIDVSLGSTGALVERNTSYRNQDSGIEIYSGSDNSTVRRNLSYDNGDHGLDCLRSPGDHVVGNTVVGNSTSGINLEGGCSNSVVGDNISVDNAVESTRTIGNIRVDEESSPGSVLNHNLVWMANGGPLFEWNSTAYATVQAFRAASGQGADDIGASPQFSDESARDLSLAFGSPAIDNADVSMAGASVADHDGIDPVDVVSVPNAGGGTPPYADRGALEYHGSASTATAPTAAIAASPGTGLVPLTVMASAAGSTPGGAAITSYTFTCGNGTTVGPQTESTATCTYGDAGTYTLGVTVVDAYGFSDSASTQVVAAAPNLPPTATLSTTGPPGATAPTNATFDASASADPEGGALTFTFACGNGTTVGPQASPNATCSYPAGGTFSASVTVVDDHGQSATSSPVQLVIATNQPPTAALKVTVSAKKAPATAVLDASGSRDPEAGPLRFTFTCGNGTVIGPTSSTTATCSYAKSRTYPASVTVTDDLGQTATASVQIRL